MSILETYIASILFNSLYITESYQAMTECGLRCELHANQCDFFVVTLSHCHLGRYSHWNQGSIQDNTERITYHKIGGRDWTGLRLQI